MISLRQHIFSLVAVFVALAIGIAAGSTVVRGPLLDSLRSRLETAEAVIEDERAENDVLAAEVAQLDRLGDDAPEQLLPGRLAGRAAMLVVAGDVSEDAVDGMARSLAAASAEFLGEVRIDSSVFDPDQAARLAQLLGMGSATSDEVQGAFGERVAALLAEVTAGVEASGEVRSVVASVFGALEDEGVVDLLQLRTGPVTAQAFDVVVLVDRNVEHDPATVLRAVVDGEEAGNRPAMIVAEVGRVESGDDDPIASFVGSIRDSGRLRDEISTVDNAETVLGWIATVLGLQAAHDGEVGHFGFRDGAQASIPRVAR